MPASKKPPSTYSQTSGRSGPLTAGSSAHDFANGNKADSDQATGGTTTRDSAAHSATDCDPTSLEYGQKYLAHRSPSVAEDPSRLPSLDRPHASGIQSGSQSPERATYNHTQAAVKEWYRSLKLRRTAHQREKIRGQERVDRQDWLWHSKARTVLGAPDAPDSRLARSSSKPEAERDPH